ncbi:hypothetical protein BDR03DRAFT_105892 [Suillus americanus]|nr:hypothetical protein BDR03DRAFT_105892 [Suillus americanus]
MPGISQRGSLKCRVFVCLPTQGPLLPLFRPVEVRTLDMARALALRVCERARLRLDTILSHLSRSYGASQETPKGGSPPLSVTCVQVIRPYSLHVCRPQAGLHALVRCCRPRRPSSHFANLSTSWPWFGKGCADNVDTAAVCHGYPCRQHSPREYLSLVHS